MIELEIRIEFESERIGMVYPDNPGLRFMIFGMRMNPDISDLNKVFFKKLSRVQGQVKTFCQRQGIKKYTDVWSLREIENG